MRDGASNNSTVRSSSQFRKFRDNSKRRLDLRKNRQSIANYPFSTAITRRTLFAKKILRSIKKRQHQSPNPRKLSFPPNSTTAKKSPKKAKTNKHDSSMEEGEIISDDDCNLSQLSLVSCTAKSSCTITANTVEDKDDDCICIEPQIEQIVIDDDQTDTSAISQAASTSHSRNKNNTSGYVSLIQRINERVPQSSGTLITSTPVCARAKDTAVTPKHPEPNVDFGALFYEDVSSINSKDFISPTGKEIDYTTLRLLSGGRCKKTDKYGKKRGKRNSKPKGKRHKKKEKRVDSSKDVIFLDDTITNDATLKPTSGDHVEPGRVEFDDSVIFISETVARSDKPAKMGDFVPLDSNNVPNPIYVPQSPPRPPRKAAIKSGLLFTSSEKKELLAYNNNTYNPNAGDPEKQSKKRFILIDACNVAFDHSLRKEFSVKGLKICIDYFEKMGHEVKAIVPQFRMHRCSDSATMAELHKAGKIVVTPCKRLPGKCAISYDDRFLLQLAAEMDAVIVSNDNYRDLINENSAFKKLIENRVLGFTWCNDLFMVAKDPYGKWGPTLQTILNRI